MLVFICLSLCPPIPVSSVYTICLVRIYNLSRPYIQSVSSVSITCFFRIYHPSRPYIQPVSTVYTIRFILETAKLQHFPIPCKYLLHFFVVCRERHLAVYPFSSPYSLPYLQHIALGYYWVIIGLLLGDYWVIIGLVSKPHRNLTVPTPYASPCFSRTGAFLYRNFTLFVW